MSEQNLTDVQYALKQLRGIPGLPHGYGTLADVRDRIRRTLDALERIEERLLRERLDQNGGGT